MTAREYIWTLIDSTFVTAQVLSESEGEDVYPFDWVCKQLQWLFYFQISSTSYLKVLEKLPLEIIFFTRYHNSAADIVNQTTASVTRMLAAIDTYSVHQKVTQKWLMRFHRKLTLGTAPTGFRTRSVTVNNPKTGKVDFVPPSASKMKHDIDHLVRYLQVTKPSLERSANILHKVIHAHPFTDGNGRLSRALGAWGLDPYQKLIWYAQCLYFMQHAEDEYIPALAALRGGQKDAYQTMVESALSYAVALVDNITSDVSDFIAEAQVESVALAFVECPVLSSNVLIRTCGLQNQQVRDVTKSMLTKGLLTQAEIDGQECLIAESLIKSYQRVRLPNSYAS